MAGIEMLHDYEGHARIGWQGFEEFGIRFQPTGGCANGYDRERIMNCRFWRPNRAWRVSNGTSYVFGCKFPVVGMCKWPESD